MKTLTYVNEKEYHEWFMCHADSLPTEMKAQADSKVLVWGHEVDAHDGGCGGGDGSIDLFTLDEEGRVWVLEAKLHSSNEFPVVWSQLLRYRDALARMSWPEIMGYTRSFLQGKEKTKPVMRFPLSGDFVSILSAWQKSIGRARVPAEELERRVAWHFENGTFGLAVLTDSENVTPCSIKEQECAWVRARSMDDCVEMHLQWRKPRQHSEGQHFRKNKKTFYLEGIYPACTPATLAEHMVPEARTVLEDTVLPRLQAMRNYNGLKTKKGAKSPKSVAAQFVLAEHQLTVLDIGWSDTDAKRVNREHKRAGTFAMKMNLHLKSFDNALPTTRQLAFKSLMEKWVPLFAKLGWEPRRSGKSLVKGTISESSFKKWHKEMLFRPSDSRENFVGMPDEKEKLNQFFDLLENFLVAAEKALFE